MTYPISATSNSWGPYAAASTLSYQEPIGTGTPPPTSNLAPPQSPSGSVTGEAATWNYTNGETSTENYTSAMVEAAQEGTPFNFDSGTFPSTLPLGLNVNETTPTYNPNADSGVQEGTPALTEVQIVADQPHNLSSRFIVNLGS